MDIKKRLHESLNELDLGTYKKSAEDTNNWGPNQMSDPDRGNPRSKPNKQGRVNITARGRFKTEFDKKYQGTTITTTTGDYMFDQIKQLNISGWYGLWFKQDSTYQTPNGDENSIDNYIFVKTDNGEPYIENHSSNDEITVSDESIIKLKEMLQYN